MSRKSFVSFWRYLKTAIWGYTTVLMFVFTVACFLSNDGGAVSGSDRVILQFVIAPMLIFFIGVCVEYKKYQWNWWKNLLASYSLFFILILTIGSFNTHTASDGSIFAGLLFVPIIIFLLLIGKTFVARE